MSNVQGNILVLVLFLASSCFVPSAQLPGQCPADKNEPWTYRGRNGPKYWGETYPQCYGQEQSPVEIDSATAERDANLAQLELQNYDVPITKATIENNGHSIEVRPGDGVERSISVNGATYNLHQFHFHWGMVRTKGSEHVLDGVQYAMEMHLVHLNGDQIAVVGIFFEEQGEANEELRGLVAQLREVQYKGEETELASELNLNNLLPANPTSYYRYEGSLTTPECAEGVTWSVVPQPMKVSTLQMLQFRRLFSATRDDATLGCTLAGNYRPVQKLNGRKVYVSE